MCGARSNQSSFSPTLVPLEQAAAPKISKKQAAELDQLAVLIDELTGGTVVDFDSSAKAALHGAGLKTALAVMKSKSPAAKSKAAKKAVVKKVSVKAAKGKTAKQAKGKAAGHSHDGVPCSGH